MGDRVHPVVQVTTHDFDLLRWYAEGEIVEVRAVETSQRLAEFDVPDVVQTVVRFSSGTIATIETHGVWPSGFPEEISARLEVTGTDGGARATAPEGGLEIATDGCAVVETGHWPRIHGKVDGTLRRQFDHFLSVLDGETPRISTGDALRTAVVTDAVVRSLDSGAPIEL
jgi:predicted dehydrogenase